MSYNMLPGLAAALLAVACDSGPAVPGPGTPPPAATGARLREAAIGLASPLFLAAPPGELNRQFIVEKTGRIRIIRNEALVPTAFLDLSAKVSNGSEQGLLGLAFHPQYAGSGLFVVNYTNLSGDTRISPFRVSTDPARPDPALEHATRAGD